eukprot:5854754-Prymnesium_polylepis.1
MRILTTSSCTIAWSVVPPHLLRCCSHFFCATWRDRPACGSTPPRSHNISLSLSNYFDRDGYSLALGLGCMT